MAPIPNHRVVYNAVPEGYPVLGETLIFDKNTTIDLEDPNLVPTGSALVKTIVLSLDPYMRGRMRKPEAKSYSPPFTLGEPITGYGISEVIRSNDPSVKPGDRVYGGVPFQQYSVINLNSPPPFNYRVIKNEENLPWSLYVGVLGMPGKTAFHGYKAFAEADSRFPKPAHETLFVTTGAGPVGATVIQLAKVDGKKVIASAGSDDKVAFMKEVGADVAFNYKTAKTQDILEQNGPVDIYWDHVGGEQLDTTLTNMNLRGRVIICGQASQYNSTEKYGVKNIGVVLAKRLTVHGLLVGDWEARYGDEFYKTMPKLVKEGKIKYREHITRGLENADKAFLEILKGDNNGKAVVILED
jgi:hypothetical protein